MPARTAEGNRATTSGGSAVTEQAVTATSSREAQRTANLDLALLLSLAIAVVLAALAFWPTRIWAPPRRPGITSPVVFDEFVNAPAAPTASPSGPSPGLN
jgi:hypothetical protein